MVDLLKALEGDTRLEQFKTDIYLRKNTLNDDLFKYINVGICKNYVSKKGCQSKEIS